MKLINFYKLFPFLLAIIFMNCEGEGPVDRTIFHPTFKGITYTNEDSPEPISEDISDWQLASDSPYRGFFANVDIFEGNYPSSNPNDSIITAIPSQYDINPAYPNPAQNHIGFSYSLPREASVVMFIIDSDERIIAKLINTIHSAGSYHLQWDLENIPSNIYRCIYRLGPWFGQGDIWIK